VRVLTYPFYGANSIIGRIYLIVIHDCKETYKMISSTSKDLLDKMNIIQTDCGMAQKLDLKWQKTPNQKLEAEGWPSQCTDQKRLDQYMCE
uniref:Uncharacterized protein n=1 Tax=Romanomermis culicivorax TaxID=13658 RepID=A0A915IJD4_ROMCU